MPPKASRESASARPSCTADVRERAFDRRLTSLDQMAPISRWNSSISLLASAYFFAISSYLFSHWSRSFSRACTLRSKCPALTSVCRSLSAGGQHNSLSIELLSGGIRMAGKLGDIYTWNGVKGMVADVLLVSLAERLVSLLCLLLEEL